MEGLAGINELFPPRESERGERPRSVEDMGSQDFLALMVAQLENQDPTKPMDNMQFMGQLAQFGTVSGIQDLNESFAGLSGSLTANRALEAASLVGRQVVTEGNVGVLSPVGEGADGAPRLALGATVDIPPGTASASLYVQDMNGRLVYSAPLPPAEGQLPVQWDGRDQRGEQLPPGRYRISAEGVVDGSAATLPTHAHQWVESVAVDAGAGEVSLALGNGSEVGIDAVKRFL